MNSNEAVNSNLSITRLQTKQNILDVTVQSFKDIGVNSERKSNYFK
jgi:hypothetical protein